MGKKWILFFGVVLFLLTGCNPSMDVTEAPANMPSATNIITPTATRKPTEIPTKTPTEIPTSTPQPTQTAEPVPVNTRAVPPGDAIQADLFGLVPPDSLSAGYCDLQQIREDPDMKSAFELVPDVCPLSFSPIPGGTVDRLISFGRAPDESERVRMAIIYVLYGDFREVTLPGLAGEAWFEDLALQEYQGFEVMVEEGGEPFNSAVLILDESTVVFGEVSGVMAVIDTALGLNSPPLADMGAVLPSVLTASVLLNCPMYEDLGCTALMIHALAQGTPSDLNLLQVYQFEDPGSAANAYDTILANIESGNTVQFGSMKIRGDATTQEGSFIIVEDALPVEDIVKIFE